MIAAVSDEEVAAVVALADIRVAAIIVGDWLTIIEEVPMQGVEADTIIQAPVVPVEHVRKEIGFMMWFLAGLNLPGRIWQLGASGRQEKEQSEAEAEDLHGGDMYRQRPGVAMQRWSLRIERWRVEQLKGEAVG